VRFYAISNVNDQGDKVGFTMTVQISYYSDFPVVFAIAAHALNERVF
jgi:hypothetical protein